MKFANGNWLMREGIEPQYAVDVYETIPQGDKLTMYASSSMPFPGAGRRRIGGTSITIELTAPMDDVIGVALTHFKGQNKNEPQFEIHEEKAAVRITENEERITYSSGRLSATFPKIPDASAWQATFDAEGKTITSASSRSIAYHQDKNTGKNYMCQQLDLGVGECLYGLGERFGPLVKNGQTIDMWMADGGTGSEQAYKNVPFYLSNKGYGVFVNTTTDVSFELATEKVERASFSVEGESLQYFIIYGDTPKEILNRYTAMTGRPALPPAWSFGLWLSTSFTTEYDEQTASSFIDGMAERNIPLHVFHFDCFWMKGNHWTDFTWDPEMFPDPKGMLARYKEKGLRICVWINPYIAQQSSLFDECAEKGYLLMKSDGSIWQTDLWQPGMGTIDFTNPEAYKWYQSKLIELMEMGVDCFKTDFGERIPVRDIAYHDGSSSLGMHNYYTHLYNKCVFEIIEQYKGKNEAVVFARSGTAGGQQFPVHWGGDNAGNYPSMAETLRAGLSLAVSGYSFWSHDIGGFENTATADLYKRWCAFGLLSSHSRLHGSMSYRVPWNFDEEASAVLAHFVRLKCSLMPYLYRQAVCSHENGTPILRPMVFDFPNDEVAAWLDRQYMLGDSLLVAPVFNDQGVVKFYVPEGRWTDYQSGKIYEGGRYYEESYDYYGLPLLVRPNTLLPIGADNSRPDYDFEKDLTLKLYAPDEGVAAKAVIPNIKGDTVCTITVLLQNGTLTVKTDHLPAGLKLLYDGKLYDITAEEMTLPVRV